MTPYLASALQAADWFVNTQVLMKKPHWDANHGRLVYTYHIPTRNRVLGLSWTQGRGIITLLAAWEAAGRPEHLRSAIQAAEYLKHLQILDARDPNCFGAIREEVPASWYVYPRDAMEAGLGLLFLWRVTGEAELLYRARIFGDWLLANTMRDGWPTGGYFLDARERAGRGYSHIFCIGGGAAFFALLAKATGDSQYLDRGLRPIAAHQREHFTREDGVILAAPRGDRGREGVGHHHAAGARYAGVAVNDDCCGLTALIAWRELGGEVYLDLSRKYGDWMLGCELPLPNHAAAGLQALTLLELARASGERKYADHARERLAPLFMKSQALGTGDAAVEGAFRGEDEPAEYYGPKGADPLEFVNTRVTAYSAGALFKLDGTVPGPYYSAFDWERPARRPPPELLAPYRL